MLRRCVTALALALSPAVVAADIVHFIGGPKQAGPLHLMSLDTVTGTYSIVVPDLHPDRNISCCNSGNVYNPSTGNFIYQYQSWDANGDPDKTYVRTVNVTTKAVIEVELDTEAPDQQIAREGPLVLVKR